MSQSHGRQKHKAKQKRKRELAKARQHNGGEWHVMSHSDVLRAAAHLPYGPTFVSSSWRSADELLPSLVIVIVTRKGPGGILMPGLALVDRTCLGVKNGCAVVPLYEAELPELLDDVEAEAGQDMEECDLLVAQSIVFHALDYAGSLGFAPHPDFPEPLFGPRPERLLDTPLARPSRPNYVSGSKDDVPLILTKLAAAVGEGEFGFVFDPAVAHLDGMDDGDEGIWLVGEGFDNVEIIAIRGVPVSFLR